MKRIIFCTLVVFVVFTSFFLLLLPVQAMDYENRTYSFSTESKQLSSLLFMPESVSKERDLNEVQPNKQENAKSKLTLGQLRKKYRSTFVTNGPHVKRVALTFDDVPDPRFTPQVLDILKKYGVKATFFVNGQRVLNHPELAKRIHDEGHVIGNHSFTHPDFNKITMPAFVKEIEKTEKAIFPITGYIPKLIRPPYGEITEEQLVWAAAHNYQIVNWNVDSLDWKGLNKEQVLSNILSGIKPGAIVLQHAGGGHGSKLQGTIEALPEVIKSLKKQGYEIVTVPELLGIDKAK
ncbi:polysaccharide deacetylase family protein [Paenibacillus sp. Marseille-Q4541]|uniref:polysaccharide deacetylase family protein n=1 Tax=Paenibacillus sp. Marseille-Q4541 TaxID=2831522 RepID=UPI002018FF2F|nr:polysaccharide deacetylase family protein [Paenibacillus sp. Marseille-Q4541]